MTSVLPFHISSLALRSFGWDTNNLLVHLSFVNNKYSLELSFRALRFRLSEFPIFTTAGVVHSNLPPNFWALHQDPRIMQWWQEHRVSIPTLSRIHPMPTLKSSNGHLCSLFQDHIYSTKHHFSIQVEQFIKASTQAVTSVPAKRWFLLKELHAEIGSVQS